MSSLMTQGFQVSIPNTRTTANSNLTRLGFCPKTNKSVLANTKQLSNTFLDF